MLVLVVLHVHNVIGKSLEKVTKKNDSYIVANLDSIEIQSKTRDKIRIIFLKVRIIFKLCIFLGFKSLLEISSEIEVE